MFSRQQAQTGKRMYGGVSQAPNRGQVSAAGAQGYIQRELRNKAMSGPVRRIGGDGQSDNRSSVAAQALQRTAHGNVGGWGGLAGNGKNQGSQRGNEGPGKQPHQNGGRPVVNPPPQGGGGVAVPTISVSEDGVLQLPYDQSYSMDQLGAIDGANQELMGIKMEGDQQALQYGQSKRNAGLAYDSLRNQTLNQNAAGGTAFSSQYGNAVTQNAGQYANQMGDLEAQNTGFINNQHMQQGAVQSSLNQQLAAMAQQYADSLNGQAGTLGYDNTRGGTSHPHRNRKHKNRGKK